MGRIGLSDDHVELAATVRRWVTAPRPRPAMRAGPRSRRRPTSCPRSGASWATWAGSGSAVSEEHGGQGYGLPELAVVLEELGRVCAPGPILSDGRGGGRHRSLGRRRQPGRRPGLGRGRRRVRGDVRPRRRPAGCHGRAAAVWGGVAGRPLRAAGADGPAGDRCAGAWSTGTTSRCASCPGFDPTRRLAEVRIDGVRGAGRSLARRRCDRRERPDRCDWPSCCAGPRRSAWPTGA